jgi:uncharacterized sulfatase
MYRFTFIILIFLSTSAWSQTRYNLITIVTDDQGRWAMGAYGNGEIHTPNMDRIAREGATFTDAITASPVCSPSRASFLTGLYPTELGITDWISPDEGNEGLGLKGITWPKVLQDNGYQTALFGKWHLGTNDEFHPTQLGYHHFEGFLAGGTKPMDAVLEVDGEKKKISGPLPDYLVTATTKWLDQNKSKPFAVSLHFRAPHLPYGPVPEADTAHYENLDPTVPSFPGADVAKLKASTKGYYASISSIDRNIGRLLDYLDKNDLSKNTILVFTSDHGYNEGRHSINTKGNGHWIAGGVRGPKRPNMWDTSVTIPLAIRWPGTIKPGTQIDYPTTNLDTFKTVLGMLNVPMPENHAVHGKDLSPIFRGKRIVPRKMTFSQYDLHNNGLAYLRMIRTDQYKLVRHFHSRMQDEMYDLKADPEEKTNLLRTKKGRERNEKVLLILREQMKDWMTSIDDPLSKDLY